MPKKRNKKKLSRLTRNKLLPMFIFILLFAAVGAYYVVNSFAFYNDTGGYYVNDNRTLVINPADNTSDSPDNMGAPNSAIQGEFTISADNLTKNNGSAPAYQAVLAITYNTKYVKFISGNCVWQYGCAESTKTDAEINQIPPGNWLAPAHKGRMILCFNIPANAHGLRAPAMTYNFQRTAEPSDTRVGANWMIHIYGFADGTCDPNQRGPVRWLAGTGGCSDWATAACDDGNGPGKGPGTLIGFGTGGPGTGVGTNGTGTGQKGTGKGGGSSGATAKTQAKEPNSIPSSSDQGTNTKQPVIEPSPFFDGKEYKPGSDVDNLIFGTTKVGGLKIVNIWIYILALLLIAGGTAAYFFWWRPKHRKPSSKK